MLELRTRLRLHFDLANGERDRDVLFKRCGISTIFWNLCLCVVFGSNFLLVNVRGYGMENMSPRVVMTKQAQFQGFLGPGNIRKNTIYQSDPFSYRSHGHPVIETFKGIPYANPPLDSLRYESPAPHPFNSSEVFTANVIKTPCPRFGNETKENLRTKDSIRGLKKITNMEDCLYLDIYAPMNSRKDTGQGLPVLVYANSLPDDDPNDPFDGSSLAAIGNIIVISFRYRVGVLGFLHPGYSNEVRSNFGLWDQLAALQWIKENINYFGGDENNMCLMASDLDASLVGVLAFSRMSQAYGGLFHRLILLNSSPFSPTSLHLRPLITTIHLARALGCPLHEREGSELLNCLRRKPVTQLLSAAQTIGIEDLEYPFAPGLDGTIVHQDLGALSSTIGSFPSSISEILSRFDLLCGLSHGPVLPVNTGRRILWQNIELERFVTAAIKLVLKLEPGARPSGNLKEDVMRSIRNEYGEQPLMRDLISDFLVVNPMIQLLNAHSDTGKNTFFYISKDYDPLGKGKHNEISYIFSNRIYQWKYIDHGKPNMDLQVFELFISFIANFVRSGDPNVANPGSERISGSTQQKSWPKYRKSQGRYLYFGQDTELRSKYRLGQTDFWSHVFPAQLKPFMKPDYDWNTGAGNSDAAPPFFGGGGRGRYPNVTHIYPAGGPGDSYTISSMTSSSVILIGCLLLLLNVLCFMGLFYQRERLKKAEQSLRKRYMENEDFEDRRASAAAGAVDQSTAELDSQSLDSGPYGVGPGPIPTHRHTLPHAQPSAILRNFQPLHQTHAQTHFPLSLDAMSETETDNGFGPDFLGPNYDPRTKVNRWMQNSSEDRPTSAHAHPVTPRVQPMHIDIHSLDRGNGGRGPPNLLTMAPSRIPEFAPVLPYTAPFHPINCAGSDIPYADSRATSPSVSNFAEFPSRAAALNNNLSVVNYNDGGRRANFTAQAQSPISMDEYGAVKRPSSATANRSSIILPVRNSMIIREMDPDDSVESSAPKFVPVRTGTLKRSVGVGSNGNAPSVVSTTATETGLEEAGIQNNRSMELVPVGGSAANMASPIEHAPTKHTHHGGTVQKVTFADGL